MKSLLFSLLLTLAIFPTYLASSNLEFSNNRSTESLNKKSNTALFGTVPFVTTWKTDNPGTSANNQITIPTRNTETYNYTVDWGDGTPTTVETGNATHTYAIPGTYTVSITGLFPQIYFSFNGDRRKILSIEQWGNNQWVSMNNAFSGCTNLDITNPAIDVPDLSNATDLASMLTVATNFNGDITAWDVSTITDMRGMFEGASSFDQDIGGWNVGNVLTMRGMFYGASAFNQNIDSWDVSDVTSVASMFRGASSFNRTIASWNVGSVTDMTYMFNDAIAFNQNIAGWNVGNVTDMTRMFEGAILFNQNIGSWNVANVTNMSSMFEEAEAFNQNIGGWDVRNVTRMDYMFREAIAFNGDIRLWDVSSVTRMSYMFSVATSFNQAIGNWNTSSAIYMDGMFNNCEIFNQDIGNWNVSNVITMSDMFEVAEAFDQDIGSWNVGNVMNMQQMFRGLSGRPTVFNQDIGGWDVSGVTDMNGMFCYNVGFNQNIGGWDVSNVTVMGGMFAEATSFNQDIGNWDVSSVTDMGRYLFSGPFIYIGGMFENATSFDQNLENWDVSSLTEADFMFSGAKLSIPNYDALLIGWNAQGLQSGVEFHGGNSIYCAGDAARANMIATDTWSITDAGTGPQITGLADQNHADNYTLPAITGINLTGNESYYTGALGSGTAYTPGTILNFADFPSYPVIIYIYDQTATSPNCQDEDDFLLTITNACTPPTADSPSDVIECTSHTLPALSANNNYYTATDAGGSLLNAGDVILSSQTIFVYVGTSSCSNENSFTVTINGNPTADVLPDMNECTSYTLPALSANNNYYTGTNGSGVLLNAGDTITTDQTIFIYAESGGAPNCTDETTFSVTIVISPTADRPTDVIECTNYVLPALSPNNDYYTGTNASGTMLNAGDAITSSQTIYVYSENGAAPNTCSDESTFDVTISGNPPVDNLPDITMCDSYTLPGLSADNDYFTATNGGGAMLNAGDVLTTSQTVYIFIETGGTPNCTNEDSFDITIIQSPTADNLDDVTACTEYLLPALSANNNYYSETNGNGTPYFAGDRITVSLTLFVYTESGANPSCSNETSFSITINNLPSPFQLDDVTECASYTLQDLPNGYNYYNDSNAMGNSYQSGDVINSDIQLFVYSGQSGCATETNFSIYIDASVSAPELQDVLVCEGYVLPILDNGSYFTQPQGQGEELLPNTVIQNSQTIYIYEENGVCSSETNFDVVIDADSCTPENIISCLIFPKFFTPNFDGANDVFAISGKANCPVNGTISIYDRYGKLMKQFNAETDHWDGTFNGITAPGTDYWYQYVDNEYGVVVKGHFALKR
mgnify:CR=1 FL=1